MVQNSGLPSKAGSLGLCTVGQSRQLAIQAVLTSLAGFLSALKVTAEQWTDAERLRAILTRAFAKFMLATASPPDLPASKTAAT